MMLPDLEGVMNVLSNITKWVNIIASVVNPMMAFLIPILLYLGEPLRDLILLFRDIVPIGEYTWFIVATAVVVVVAIILCFLFPGEKSEKDN
jgi:hypothetical protein